MHFTPYFFYSTTYAQTLNVPENDSTFTSEFRDGDEWAYSKKNNFIVGICNEKINEGYGNHFKIKLFICNLTDSTYLFDPDTISALIVTKKSEFQPLKVYCSKDFQKKLQHRQNLVNVISAIGEGLSSTQSSYVNIPGVGYGTITTYNNNIQGNEILRHIRQQEQNSDKQYFAENYLRKNSIHAGETIFGYMNIQYKSGYCMKVTIPINGAEFTYEWSLLNLLKK